MGQIIRFNKRVQMTTGKSHVLYVGITCGLSAPYIAGQLDFCIERLDRFTPVLIGFNPVDAARSFTYCAANLQRS